MRQISVVHDAEGTAAARWREFLAEPLSDSAIEISPRGFAGTSKRSALGHLWVARVTARPHAVSMHAAAGSATGSVMIILQYEGKSTFTQHGRATALTAGEWIMLDGALPWSIDNLTKIDQIAIILQRENLTCPLARQSSMIIRPLPRESAPFRIMWPLLLALTGKIQHIQAPNRCDMGDVVLRSVNAALAERQGGQQTAADPDVICERVKALIRLRYRDPDFGIGEIARALGISKRSLHNVFKGETWTINQYIRHARMDRARWMIGHVDAKALPISAIAYSSGFRDISQFSHLFRNMFEMSPTEARAV